MLLDRSGQGKVYPLINRRRFQQMDVLEGLNVLVTISGIVKVALRYLSIHVSAGQNCRPEIISILLLTQITFAYAVFFSFS